MGTALRCLFRRSGSPNSRATRLSSTRSPIDGSLLQDAIESAYLAFRKRHLPPLASRRLAIGLALPLAGLGISFGAKARISALAFASICSAPRPSGAAIAALWPPSRLSVDVNCEKGDG